MSKWKVSSIMSLTRTRRCLSPVDEAGTVTVSMTMPESPLKGMRRISLTTTSTPAGKSYSIWRS